MKKQYIVQNNHKRPGKQEKSSEKAKIYVELIYILCYNVCN